MLYRLYVVVTYVSSLFSWANSVTIVVLLNETYIYNIKKTNGGASGYSEFKDKDI